LWVSVPKLVVNGRTRGSRTTNTSIPVIESSFCSVSMRDFSGILLFRIEFEKNALLIRRESYLPHHIFLFQGLFQ